MSSDPLPFDDAMRRMLDADRVPALSSSFVDRVVAATEGRSAPLPQKRSAPARRWRTGRRLIVGVVAFGALATAATATGVLKQLGLNLPSPQAVWSAMTGDEPENPAVAPIAPRKQPHAGPSDPIKIDGKIDSTEELEEVFRRVDDARSERIETRRQRVDERLDAAIERRREQGLPVPSPEREAELRQRIEESRDRFDQRRDQRSGERREELRKQLEQDGELAREDILGVQRDTGVEAPVADRLERFRQMSPEERRARLQELRQDRLAKPEPTPDP